MYCPQKLESLSDEVLLWVVVSEGEKCEPQIWKAGVLKEKLKECEPDLKEVFRALQTPAKISWCDLYEATKTVLKGVQNERYYETGAVDRWDVIVPDETVSKIYNLLADCTFNSGCFFMPDIDSPVTWEKNDV